MDMARAAHILSLPKPEPLDLLVAPTQAQWSRLSPEEREAFLVASLEAQQVPAEAMAEGAPHFTSKVRIWRLLGDHFRRIGRSVYLACELPVHYAGERVFAPDLIAVCDVPDPGEADSRLAWIVGVERKGVDFAIEVLHRGDSHKDLVRNVERYARLGIQEYFVYDRLRECVYAYRLPSPRSRRYTEIPAQDGLYPSAVLGLELGLRGGRLCFMYQGAEVEGSAELLDRANQLVRDLQDRLDARDLEIAEARAALQAAEQRSREDHAAREELERELAALRARRG